MTRESPRTDAVFSPASVDFEAFPPTVKRKYFSTLERLRYAQGQLPLSPVQAPSPTTMNVFRPKSSSGPRQRSSQHARRPSLFHLRSSPRHSREPAVPDSPSVTVDPLSQEDLEWYHSLPDKIKRNHFTTQERCAYASNVNINGSGSSQNPSAPSAESQFYRMGNRNGNRSLPSLSSCSEAASAKDDLQTPLEFHGIVGNSNESNTHDDFSVLDADTALDLILDDYHSAVVESANVAKVISPQSYTTPRPRALTLSTLTLTPGLSKTKEASPDHSPSSIPQEPPSLRQRYQQDMSNLSTPVPAFERSTSPKGPTLLERRTLRKSPSLSQIHSLSRTGQESAHDVTTRMKLNLYGGPTNKFDHAVEFGFPSLTGPAALQQSTSPSRPSSISLASHRRSLSVGALSRSARQSLSIFRGDKRESVAIGTTFFYDEDDYDSDEERQASCQDIDTVRNSISTYNVDMASEDTAVDAEPCLGDANFPIELPADVPLQYIVRRSQSSTRLSEQSEQFASFIALPMSAPATKPETNYPAYAPARPRVSRSISLKPYLDSDSSPVDMTALPQVPQSATEFTTWDRSEVRSPKNPLRPWESADKDLVVERETTLRLTLTRKDLRADDSLIYPDGGNGSWTSSNWQSKGLEREPLTPGRWKFWARRR